MIPVKSGKDRGLRSWGLSLWVQVDHDKSPLDHCLRPPSRERRRESGGDLRRFIQGKGKMKGDYGDPARERPNKLTPKVLPWHPEKTLMSGKPDYCPFSCHIRARNAYLRQSSLALQGTSSIQKRNFQNPTLLLNKDSRVCYIFSIKRNYCLFFSKNSIIYPIKEKSS